MDVVSDASAVGRGIVIAKNVEMRSLTDNDLLNIGEQIVGMDKRLIS